MRRIGGAQEKSIQRLKRQDCTLRSVACQQHGTTFGLFCHEHHPGKRHAEAPYVLTTNPDNSRDRRRQILADSLDAVPDLCQNTSDQGGKAAHSGMRKLASTCVA